MTRLESPEYRSDVSILVVVDWSRQQRSSTGRHASRIEFQSLLWWIGRSTARIRSVRWRSRVSILVVVDWSRQRGSRSRAERRTEFQSLLWWIGRVNT